MSKKIKNYKIIPIKHLLKNNVMANSGDVVSGSKFVDLQRALKDGICKETNEKISSKDKKKNVPVISLGKSDAELAKEKEAKKAKKEADKKAKKAKKELAKKAKKEAADAKKLAEDNKGNDDDNNGEDSVDLNTLTIPQLKEFAKDNEFELTKETIKAGKDAIVASIADQAAE